MTLIDFKTTGVAEVALTYHCRRCGAAWERSARGAAIIERGGSHRTDTLALERAASRAAKSDAESRLTLNWKNGVCPRCLFPSPFSKLSWAEYVKKVFQINKEVQPGWGCLTVLGMIGVTATVAGLWLMRHRADPIQVITFGLWPNAQQNSPGLGVTLVMAFFWWGSIFLSCAGVIFSRTRRRFDALVTPAALDSLMNGLPPSGLHLLVLDLLSPGSQERKLLRWCTRGYPNAVTTGLLKDLSLLTDQKVSFDSASTCAEFLEKADNDRSSSYEARCDRCGVSVPLMAVRWVDDQTVCPACVERIPAG